jgi:hypothetical protein
MILLMLISIGWPLPPLDSTQALGNNWGEYQNYGGSPYMHPGIDVMGITVGKPVHAVQDGVVKAWLTTSGQWHWRLAIADYQTNDSVEAWLYAHIDPYMYHKNVGEYVTEGELIGYLVEWPVTGFDHIHFARIKDAGAIWNVGDWAFIQNPLMIIEPYDDTTKPVFENAYGSDLFAFCQNNTSNYLDPAHLTGSVDIIAKIFDDTGYPLMYQVWERLIPYKIEYEIHGPQNVPVTLSFIWYGVLYYASNLGVIYKDDAVCNTRGDYEYRDYYFIVTNTDGDSLVETSDASYAWNTMSFPDGDYWVVVGAYDAAGNYQRDSMLVTVDNVGVTEVQSSGPVFRTIFFSTPHSGTIMIPAGYSVTVMDVCGRLVAGDVKVMLSLDPGVYFAIIRHNDHITCDKIIIVE